MIKRFLNFVGRMLGKAFLKFAPSPKIQDTPIVKEVALVTKIDHPITERDNKGTRRHRATLLVNELTDNEPLPDCIAPTNVDLAKSEEVIKLALRKKPRKKVVPKTEVVRVIGIAHPKKKTTKKKGK
jgi:hypothetical protein